MGMNADNAAAMYPDFRAAGRFRKSWQCCVPGFDAVLRDLRSMPAGELEDGNHQLINVSSGKYVYSCQCDGWKFAYKTQQGKTFWRYMFRPSLPWREALHYSWLHELGVPAPRVLALGDTRVSFVLKESFIITDFLAQTHDGRIFMPKGQFRTGYEDLCREFCIGNLKLLAKVHDAGYFHKASHPRNFLFRGDTPESMEIFWIDVARMRKMSDPRRAVIVDLHTFFRDMRLPQTQVHELIGIYLQCLQKKLFNSSEELLQELINFKRRRFSRRKYKLFDCD